MVYSSLLMRDICIPIAVLVIGVFELGMSIKSKRWDYLIKRGIYLC